MKLYHYSAGKFDRLLTLNQQHKELGTKVPNKFPGQTEEYGTHISFFFDKIPLDIIAGIFGHKHGVWRSHSELYEYVVDSTTIGNFKYHIVESPEKTKLYYDKSLTDKQYDVELDKVEKEMGYWGRGNTVFEASAKPLVGGTRKAYMQLPHHPNFEQIRNKYAATVPHVMLYPDSGVVEYEHCAKVHVR